MDVLEYLVPFVSGHSYGAWQPRHWRDVKKSAPVEQAGDVVEPIDVDYVHRHTQIVADDTDVDLWIQDNIPAARRLVEKDLGWSLVAKPVEMVFDQFPVERELEIQGPIASVTSLSWFDTNNAETTVSTSAYYADTWSIPGRVILTYGSVWPTGTRPQIAGRLRWIAGASAIDDRYRTAMALVLTHWFANRGDGNANARDSQMPLPVAYDALLSDRIVSFG